MIEFELIDDTQELNVELEDNTQNVEFNLTDYDDSEVRELIDDVDRKVDTLEININNQIDNINDDISSLERNVQTNTTNISNLQTNKADKTQVNTLDNQVSENTGQIAQNKADIEALDNRVDQIPIVTKTSQLTNDSGFITKSVNDLVNYYKKSETFTKQEVNDLISAISTLTLEVVQTLPTQDISTTTIYLVPKTTAETNDVYDEYIYVSNAWEHIGSTQADLTNYYTKTETDVKINCTINDTTYTTVQSVMDELISQFGYAVDQKQSKIDSSNKLDSDLVSDANQTNKFVTANEKTTWNNKSDFSGSANDLSDKPTITYVEGVPNSSKVVELTNVTETIVGNKNIEDYGVPKFIPIDLSVYDTTTRNKQLKPYTQLPDGNYVVTSRGNIYFAGAGSYFAEEGTFIFKFDGYEVTLIGPDGPALYLYDEDNNEWSGGGFTTSDDVDTAIEMAMPLISNYKSVGVKTPDDFDTGLHIIDMASGAMLPLTLSINVEGTTQTYTPIENGTLIIKTKNNNFHVIGTEALFFEYDSINSYYKKPVDLLNADFVTSSDLANYATKAEIPKYYYGTCATSASTQAKVVVCDGFVLEAGATISVLFTNAQTYNGAPTLNVNGTGAVTVQYKSGTNGVRYMWSAGEIIDFTYNGTYWVMHRSALATTTYYGLAKYSASLTSTSSALALTPSAMNTAMLNIISGTPVYSASATYNVGDRVRYSNNVWKCNTAITTAEAWNAEHWDVEDSLQDQIDNKPVLQHRSLNDINIFDSITINGTKKITDYGIADIIFLQLDETGVNVLDISTLDTGIYCTSLGGWIDVFGNNVEITQALIFFFGESAIIYDLTGVTYYYDDGTTDTIATRDELDALENRMYKKAEIITGASLIGIITLEDNTRVIRTKDTGINKLTVHFPDVTTIDVNFKSWIVFRGSASFVYNPDVGVDCYYTGTDCSGGVFTPQVSKEYNMEFTYNGFRFICNVLGYAY